MASCSEDNFSGRSFILKSWKIVCGHVGTHLSNLADLALGISEQLKGSIEGDIADAQKIRHTGTMNFQENQVFEVCPSNGEETQPGMEISPQQKLQSPQLFVLSKLDNYEAQLQVTNIK